MAEKDAIDMGLQVRGAEKRLAWVILNVNILFYLDPQSCPMLFDVATGKRLRKGVDNTELDEFYPAVQLFYNRGTDCCFDPFQMAWIEPPRDQHMMGAAHSLYEPLKTMAPVFMSQLHKFTRFNGDYFVSAPMCPSIGYVGTRDGRITRFAFTSEGEAVIRVMRAGRQPAELIDIITQYLGMPLDRAAMAAGKVKPVETNTARAQARRQVTLRRMAKRKREVVHRQKEERAKRRCQKLYDRPPVLRNAMRIIRDAMREQVRLKTLVHFDTGRRLFSDDTIAARLSRFQAQMEDLKQELRVVEGQLETRECEGGFVESDDE